TKWDEESTESISHRLGVRFDFPMERGGVIGIVDMVDCVESSDSKWFVGRFGFVLTNTRRLPFTPVSVSLGLRRPSDDLLRRYFPSLGGQISQGGSFAKSTPAHNT